MSLIPAPSSSRISRLRAAVRLSPGSTFPPGNSQRPARRPPAGRSWMRTRPSFSMTATTTSILFRLSFLGRGMISWIAVPRRHAGGADRTGQALGAAAPAEESPELHHGLVEFAGRVRGEDGREEGAELPVDAGHGRAPKAQQPHEDAPDVGVDDGERPAVGEAQDGGRGVGPEPGQPPERRFLIGDLAAVLPDDGSGRGVQVPGPLIIAQPLPFPEDLPQRGPGQAPHVGEDPEPALVVGDDGRDGRLLEHDLGDPDPVGIFRPAPGQLSPVGPIPGQELGPRTYFLSVLPSSTAARGGLPVLFVFGPDPNESRVDPEQVVESRGFDDDLLLFRVLPADEEDDLLGLAPGRPWSGSGSPLRDRDRRRRAGRDRRRTPRPRGLRSCGGSPRPGPGSASSLAGPSRSHFSVVAGPSP